MSKKHPIIAITGSSGAGTTTVKHAFEHLFLRLHIKPAIVEGDSYHRYDRSVMQEKIRRATEEGRHFSHFSIEANLLGELEALYREYGESGTGKCRFYIHGADESAEFGGRLDPGSFTEWMEIPPDTDLLFYEGLHGAVVTDTLNLPKYTDLAVGVVPIVNLEWIQKVHRDTAERGYKPEDVTRTILRRMYDYVHVIAPQFSMTDINFQRVPTVDTSNPFVARDIPTPDESFVIIRFNDPGKFNVDFPNLLAMLQNSFMSRYNTLVVPGGKMGLAMEIIFRPILEQLMQRRKLA